MKSQTDQLPVGALIVLAAIGFTAITTELLPSGLLPRISADFHVSEATAGYLTGIGAVGIYNQSAILRAGGAYKDAANGLTVLTIQIGITIGAMFGAAALTFAGPLLVPVAAAVPAVVAFVLVVAGRRHAYPPGPQERPKERPTEGTKERVSGP